MGGGIWLRMVAAGLAAAAAASTAFAEDFRYRNDRFGTTLTVPVDVFTIQLPGPENGDGQAWRARDGAELFVYGAYNVLEQTLDELCSDVASGGDARVEITYRRVADDWCVVSGTAGRTIFYERHEFGLDEEVIHSLAMRYPAALRGRYDPLVGPIATSLGSP
ncbi:MAG: hypothetical protein Q8Q62_17270 [Mesorhizobium sp.]|nr:hypothetical protein [Mesorhizobium sp.]